MASKSTKIKIILGFLIILIMAVVGGGFFISSKVSPDEIKNVTLENLKKTFPNSEFILENIDYSIGLSLKLNVNKFEVYSKRKTKRDVLKINDVKVSIPFWAILTGGGTIELSVDQPEIYFYQMNAKENNFTYAFKIADGQVVPTPPNKDLEETKKSNENPSSGEGEMKIANFFVKSSLNVKFTNIKVNYSLDKKQKGQVEVEKLLVKNLNFIESTSFELATILTSEIGQDKLSLNSLLIGDININEILRGKDFKSNLRLTVENFSFGDLIKDLPTINSDFKINIDSKSKKISANLNSDLSSLGFIKSVIEIDGEKIYVQGIDSQINLKEVMDHLGQKIDFLSPNNSKLSLIGAVRINKGIITPKLNFDLKPGIVITANKDISLENEFKGSIDGHDIEITSLTKLLKGEIESKVTTKFNVNSPVTEPSKFAPINISLSVNDITLKEDFIKDTLYSRGDKEGKEKEGKAKQKNKDTVSASQKKGRIQKTPKPKLPRVNLKLGWRNIAIGKETFAGSGKVFIKDNIVDSDDFGFSFSKGKGNIDFLVKLLENNGNQTKFDFRLDGLNLDSLKLFLPPQVDVVTGIFSGNAKGEVSMIDEKLRHNINLKLNASNGEVKGIQIGPIIQSVADNFSFTKGKAQGVDKSISNNFETLLLNMNAKENKYSLHTFRFVGVDKRVDISGKGDIYPPGQLGISSLNIEIMDNTGKLSTELEKQTGSKVLPVLLKGPGFDLKPDYLYTTKILAKGAVKKNQAKVKEKAKEEGKKRVEEILKNNKNKEKIKGILKGLF